MEILGPLEEWTDHTTCFIISPPSLNHPLFWPLRHTSPSEATCHFHKRGGSSVYHSSMRCSKSQVGSIPVLTLHCSVHSLQDHLHHLMTWGWPGRGHLSENTLCPLKNHILGCGSEGSKQCSFDFAVSSTTNYYARHFMQVVSFHSL